jgi:plasmid stabilization system protein ParE
MEILKIEWSKEAIISLENILNYIELNFGNSIALQYYKNVETTLLQIQNFPYLSKNVKII